MNGGKDQLNLPLVSVGVYSVCQCSSAEAFAAFSCLARLENIAHSVLTDRLTQTCVVL